MRGLALLFAFGALLGGCARHRPAPPAGRDAAPAAPTASTPTPETPPTPTTPSPPVVAPKPRPVKVKLVLRSNPPKAAVFWGRKALGQTPVTIERPRDSGPVDLVVRAEGYLPLHLRAYTFRTEGITAKLTRNEDRQTLLGAKHDEPLPNDPAPSPLEDGAQTPTPHP